MTFPAGELTAIIGPNGAGKSTFFNILSGAFAPSEGRIYFRSRDITGTPQHRFARLEIAKSFQITRLAAERTMILVEHKMKLVMGISSRLIVLHHGELLAEGTPADVRASDEVRRVYLGQGSR